MLTMSALSSCKSGIAGEAVPWDVPFAEELLVLVLLLLLLTISRCPAVALLLSCPLAKGSGLGDGNAPSWPGVPDADMGFANPMRTGPLPGKISCPFKDDLAATALSTRSKLINPQFL